MHTNMVGMYMNHHQVLETTQDTAHISNTSFSSLCLRTSFLSEQLRFDAVFDEKATNEAVFRETALPLVEEACSGKHTTCFMYDQFLF